jgi:DNA (cytosine-5)-methyltransferase 1
MRTVTAGPVGGDRVVVAPVLVNTRNGERQGQRPRVRDIREPSPTVTAEGSQGALVAAFLAKHYGGPGGHPTPGQDVRDPAGAVTSRGQLGPVAVWLDKLHGSARAGQALDTPAPTVTAGGGRGGGHAALCAAFLMRYFGTGGQWADPRRPMPTITAREGLAVVTTTIAGEEYVLTDIGMRMLQPRELARAQGFPDDYLLTGTKGQQIERIGNSVCPPVARAIASLSSA